MLTTSYRSFNQSQIKSIKDKSKKNCAKKKTPKAYETKKFIYYYHILNYFTVLSDERYIQDQNTKQCLFS
jgi:hypothetical protein